MFEILMLLGFAYAGFCHLFPEGREVRFRFGKKLPAGRGEKGSGGGNRAGKMPAASGRSASRPAARSLRDRHASGEFLFFPGKSGVMSRMFEAGRQG